MKKLKNISCFPVQGCRHSRLVKIQLWCVCSMCHTGSKMCAGQTNINFLVVFTIVLYPKGVRVLWELGGYKPSASSSGLISSKHCVNAWISIPRWRQLTHKTSDSARSSWTSTKSNPDDQRNCWTSNTLYFTY